PPASRRFRQLWPRCFRDGSRLQLTRAYGTSLFTTRKVGEEAWHPCHRVPPSRNKIATRRKNGGGAGQVARPPPPARSHTPPAGHGVPQPRKKPATRRKTGGRRAIVAAPPPLVRSPTSLEASPYSRVTRHPDLATSESKAGPGRLMPPRAATASCAPSASRSP